MLTKDEQIDNMVNDLDNIGSALDGAEYDIEDAVDGLRQTSRAVNDALGEVKELAIKLEELQLTVVRDDEQKPDRQTIINAACTAFATQLQDTVLAKNEDGSFYLMNPQIAEAIMISFREQLERV